MKKIAALVGTMLLVAATTASADHRLLITDVLDQGHFDGTVAYESAHLFEHPSREFSVADFSVGAGVVKNLEVTISAPFVLSEYGRDRTTFGDPTITAKYRILNENPVTVTAGLAVTIDTDSDVSVGTTFAPLLAVSKNVGKGCKPYAAYLPVLREEGLPDTHAVRIGVEKQFNEMVTLDVRFDAAFYTGTWAADFQTYDLRFATYLQLAKNFYLIPSLGFGYLRDNYNDDGTYTLGTALYYMF